MFTSPLVGGGAKSVYIDTSHPLPKGYFEELENTELTHLIPPSLENKRDVLFGNLPEIFEFHNR